MLEGVARRISLLRQEDGAELMSLETHPVQCPYCGESIEVDVETLNESQSFIEDCTVCCRPIQYEASLNMEGEVEVTANRSE